MHHHMYIDYPEAYLTPIQADRHGVLVTFFNFLEQKVNSRNDFVGVSKETLLTKLHESRQSLLEMPLKSYSEVEFERRFTIEAHCLVRLTRLMNNVERMDEINNLMSNISL